MHEGYRHPIDEIEPSQDVESAQEEARRLFRAAVLPCLPAASYGQMRRFAAGYNRFVILCFVTSPEWFQGMTKRDLAARLGLSYRALMMDVQVVEELIGVRARRSGNCKNVKKADDCQKSAGPSRTHSRSEVPRESELSP